MKMASSGFRAALLLGTHLALLSCAAAFSMGGSFAPATAASRFLRPAVCLKGHVSAAARRGRGAALGVVASDGGGGVDAMTIKFAAGLKEHLTELWGPPGTEDFSLYADDLEFKDPLVAVKGLNLFKLNFKILKDSPLSYEPEFITHDTAAVYRLPHENEC